LASPRRSEGMEAAEGRTRLGPANPRAPLSLSRVLATSEGGSGTQRLEGLHSAGEERTVMCVRVVHQIV